MAWATLIVAIVSVAIAAGGLKWTIGRDREQTKALERESAERKAADSREERRREEELEILRQQFQQAERRQVEHQAERRQVEHQAARLVGEIRSTSGSERGVDYTVRIRNVGQSAADDVYVWLAERQPGDRISGPITNQHRLGTITPDDDWLTFALSQPSPAPIGVGKAGVILADWNDGNGKHRGEHTGRFDIVR